MGIATRETPSADLKCIYSDCSTTNKSAVWFIQHIVTTHNSGKQVTSEFIQFPLAVAISSGSSRQQQISSTGQSLANDEAMDIDSHLSTSESIGSSGVTSSATRSHPYNHTPHSIKKSLSNLGTLQNLSVKSFSDLSTLGLQLINLDFLELNPVPALLVCIECKHGITSKSALDHIKSHNIKIVHQDKSTFAKIIEASIDYKHDLPYPPAHSPPIRGLKVSQGWGCTLCNYCSTSSGSFKTHFSKFHPDKTGSHASQMKSIYTQQYFQHSCCFEVNPLLANLEIGNSYELYLKQYTPTLTTSHLLPAAASANEVPPLLKVTQWHEHLKDYINTRSKVQFMMSLVKLPTANNGDQNLGKPLAILVEKYLKDIRQQANSASFALKYLLIECPRYF